MTSFTAVHSVRLISGTVISVGSAILVAMPHPDDARRAIVPGAITEILRDDHGAWLVRVHTHLGAVGLRPDAYCGAPLRVDGEVAVVKLDPGQWCLAPSAAETEEAFGRADARRDLDAGRLSPFAAGGEPRSAYGRAYAEECELPQAGI